MAARAQQRSGMTLVHGSLIGFVVLWLVSTVLLVVLFLDQDEMENKDAQLQRDIRTLVSSSEKQELQDYFGRASSRGPTVVGLLEEARAATAELATGNAADNPEVVRTKVAEALGRVVDDGLVAAPEAFAAVDLVAAFSQMYDAFRTERSARESAEEQLSDLARERDELAFTAQALQADFDDQVVSLREEFNSETRSHEQYRTDRDASFARADERIVEFRQQAAKQSQDFRAERAGLMHTIDELQTRYAACRDELGHLQISPQQLVTARSGDAVVLTAAAGDDVIYIDLGKDDRIVLGMQFAIYSADTGIPASGRAKAQVEVVTIYDHASACRVTGRRPGTWVTPGDIAANPVYDRERTLRFVVVGDFDSNGDGRADSQGARQVEAIITQWGGEVLAELSPLVDFIVIGQRPILPYEVRDPSPEQEARNRSTRQRVEAYRKTVEDAQAFSVPVLTQSVLARFLGNTGRMASAR
ncbi:MAG: hypothetical protein IID37_14870 [Planctomycetes bacterium]|nr:hypothetical protein [Planctomycetota bacterium]